MQRVGVQLVIFISKTHGNYSTYKPIIIIYRKTHENITLFHYSVVTIFYLKPMDIAFIKTHGKYYSKETFEVTI